MFTTSVGRSIDARGRSLLVGALALLLTSVPARAAEDLADMSLEELMNIEVVSVSKKSQSKTDTAAAITVITSEDIRRGGFTLLPEVLRTVPGLQVARVDANHWSISVRGLNSLFANKLLVIVDGRTVYTPTFGGVYWNVQDYPLEDIDRIEVIRGPGGTVWGANAVNGVINIITKHARDTQGTLVSGYGGSHEQGGTGRFGGRVGENTEYRAYVRGFRVDDQDVRQDGDGFDEWRRIGGGFRADTRIGDRDTLRISADYYDIKNDQNVFNPAGPPPLFRGTNYAQEGGNALVEWQHQFDDDSAFKAKAYYDRGQQQFLLNEDRHTADIELQHDFVPVEDVSVTWGANYRYSTNHLSLVSQGVPITFRDNDEDVHLASVFGQAQVDLLDGMLSLIAGTKLTYYSWSDFEYQPSGRFVFRPSEGHSIWGAVSRSVRTPVQTDRDLLLVLPAALPTGQTLILNGDRGFDSEELIAFELGYRFFAFERFNAEIALFWNEYDDLSFFSGTPTPFPLPVSTVAGNDGETTTRGVEVEVNLMPVDWLRIRTSYAYFDIDDDPPESSLTRLYVQLTDPSKANPEHQFTLQTFMELPMGFELDTSIYVVDGLPGVVPTGQTDNVEHYLRLDLRLGYRPVEWAEISLVGQNLTDRRHYESQDITLGESTQVPRSGYGKVTFRF